MSGKQKRLQLLALDSSLSAKAGRLFGEIAGVLVATVGQVSTWLAPVPSAILVGRASGLLLGLPAEAQVVVGAVLELIGLNVTTLRLNIEEYNSYLPVGDKARLDTGQAHGLVIGYFMVAGLLSLMAEATNLALRVDPEGVDLFWWALHTYAPLPASLCGVVMAYIAYSAMGQHIQLNRRLAMLRQQNQELAPVVQPPAPSVPAAPRSKGQPEQTVTAAVRTVQELAPAGQLVQTQAAAEQQLRGILEPVLAQGRDLTDRQVAQLMPGRSRSWVSRHRTALGLRPGGGQYRAG